MSYEIITDSASNLTDDLLAEFNIHAVSYFCHINGQEYLCYEKGRPFVEAAKAFYKMMKGQAEVKTTLINTARLAEVFEPFLAEGKDILFIAMSSGLTGTFQAALVAQKELEEKYPERKCIVVDSVAASLGEGIQVIAAAKMRNEGKSIDDVAEYIINTRLNMNSIFTVDDLMYLKRGGRISSATAIIGTLLNIKPILRATSAGKIDMICRMRGKKKALDYLVEYFENKVDHPENQIIGISHCDCEEDAEYVAKKIEGKFNIKETLIRYYDLCSGAHVGPGAVALFFVSTGR